jgi:hypothetical protein
VIVPRPDDAHLGDRSANSEVAMLSLLPLDDQLNHLFYIDGSSCRLVFSRSLGRCVLIRESTIGFDHAVSLIAAGELLWNPPLSFETLSPETRLEKLDHEYALLTALLESPTGRRISSWKIRRWLELRRKENRDWAAQRVLARDDADGRSDQGGHPPSAPPAERE